MKAIIPAILLLITFNSHAAIHKEALICKETNSMCFYWWPELPAIVGWQQDKDSSINYSLNAQAPIGYTFNNAESVIYATAIIKDGNIKSLEEFIARDQKSTLAKDSDIIIKMQKPIANSSGIKFISYSFTPKKIGNWELVHYTEEVDKDKNQYYLVFTLSSRTENGFLKSRQAYENLIKTYKP